MELFHSNRQEVLLSAINQELLKHGDNLQRALDGKSAFYLPDAGQRINIQVEQARLTSMYSGVATLGIFWNVSNQLTSPLYRLNRRNYATLRAGVGLAYMQATHCALTNVHPVCSAQQRQGLLDLFLYFDCKLDAANPDNPAYYTYDTLQTTVGYISHIRTPPVK